MTMTRVRPLCPTSDDDPDDDPKISSRSASVRPVPASALPLAPEGGGGEDDGSAKPPLLPHPPFRALVVPLSASAAQQVLNVALMP